MVDSDSHAASPMVVDDLWVDVNIATMDASLDGAYGAIESGAIAVTNGRVLLDWA